MPGLEKLNAISTDDARAALLECCGSTKWARRMTDERPFQDVEELLSKNDRVWWSLDAEDWLEAFAAHPKIGQKKNLPGTSGSKRWAEEEQSRASNASRDTATELIQSNIDYEKKFGYIFIVCATGKSAEEMLGLLQSRMKNDSFTELRIAAEEQLRITRLRLDKMLNS